MASQIEISEQADPKEKGGAAPNNLLDEFSLNYYGGHPSLKVDKPEWGSLQVFERAVIFKNLRNRIRMQMSRIAKVTLESHVQVRVRKIPEVNLPESKASKNVALAQIQQFIRKNQRFVVVDYAADTGESKPLVFWGQGGNPRYAKHLKEVLDGAIRKASRDRAARQGGGEGADGTAPLPAGVATPGATPATAVVPTPRRPTVAGRLQTSTMGGMRGGLHEVSQDAIEAAKRATMGDAPDPALTLTTVMRDVSEGRPCPYCKFSLKDPTVVCSVCAAEHHEGCWKANFGCTTENCRGKAVKKGEAPLAPAAAPAAPPAAAAPAAAAPVATATKFQVILKSAGRTESEREAVARQMASLFNIPVEKVRLVLQKVPAVAKRNLPQGEAESLAARFREIGADAHVQEMV
jgi:ribosomal protein L7/L12